MAPVSVCNGNRSYQGRNSNRARNSKIIQNISQVAKIQRKFEKVLVTNRELVNCNAKIQKRVSNLESENIVLKENQLEFLIFLRTMTKLKPNLAEACNAVHSAISDISRHIRKAPKKKTVRQCLDDILEAYNSDSQVEKNSTLEVLAIMRTEEVNLDPNAITSKLNEDKSNHDLLSMSFTERDLFHIPTENENKPRTKKRRPKDLTENHHFQMVMGNEISRFEEMVTTSIHETNELSRKQIIALGEMKEASCVTNNKRITMKTKSMPFTDETKIEGVKKKLLVSTRSKKKIMTKYDEQPPKEQNTRERQNTQPSENVLRPERLTRLRRKPRVNYALPPLNRKLQRE